MRNPQQRAHLRDEAVALRLTGKSVREIKEALGPVGKRTLGAALKGTAPAEWTRRPNAKDDLRERARELRTQGQSYNEIAAALGVAKSSVSLWVRDLPCPPRFEYVHNERRLEGLRRHFEACAAEHAAEIQAAAAEIGELTDRELLIAGAIAYWCEGTKRKRPRNQERVVFVNSDPGLVQLFLRFLASVGVDDHDLRFNLSIHETADVQAAHRFWQDVVGAAREQFNKPTIKRHNPKTNRKNRGENYHGCLRVEVRRSGELYRRIEGWATGAVAA